MQQFAWEKKPRIPEKKRRKKRFFGLQMANMHDPYAKMDLDVPVDLSL